MPPPPPAGPHGGAHTRLSLSPAWAGQHSGTANATPSRGPALPGLQGLVNVGDRGVWQVQKLSSLRQRVDS